MISTTKKKITNIIAYIIEVLKISGIVDLGKTVEDLIRAKFKTKADDIIKALHKFSAETDGKKLETSIKNELKAATFSDMEQDLIWDFLFVFVIHTFHEQDMVILLSYFL